MEETIENATNSLKLSRKKEILVEKRIERGHHWEIQKADTCLFFYSSFICCC